MIVLITTIVLAAVQMAAAGIYNGFPVSQQLIPVARHGAQYSYQFNNDTFKSDQGGVSYSVENLPTYLSFDTSDRTLSGYINSSVSDSEIVFQLIGSDGSSNMSSDVSIVVSDHQGPEISTDFTVLNQLAEFGRTNGVDGLVLSPGEIFNVTFDKKTFESDDSIVAYYGRSYDHTPLPNWLFFDEANLRFSGTAPAVQSQIAPGFQYSFVLIATDYAGYTGNSVEFSIIVGAHEITTDLKNKISINGSSSDSIDYDLPLQNVYEDGVAISTANISSVALQDNPDWLSLDNYTLKGVVPDDFSSANFSVKVNDLYGNYVELYFEIQAIDSLFTIGSLNYVNATRGDFFQYYLTSSDFTDYQNTNISVDFGDHGDWLHFTKGNLTLNGDTPTSFTQTQITITAQKGQKSDYLSFMIYGVDSVLQSSSSSSTSATSSTSTHSSTSGAVSSTSSAGQATSTGTSPVLTTKQKSNKTAIAIGCGVAIPLFVIIVALVLLFLCYRKRKAPQQDEEKSPKISGPILGNKANDPNSLPPNTHQSSSSSDNDDTFDFEEEPKQLAALNELKLDNEKYESDTTTIDGSSSMYHDALQSQSTDMLLNSHNEHIHQHNQLDDVPKKSWRDSTPLNAATNNRQSVNSLCTVSTNELFSIRLVNNDSMAKDPRKSNLGLRDSAFMGSVSSSSKNFEVLDQGTGAGISASSTSDKEYFQKNGQWEESSRTGKGQLKSVNKNDFRVSGGNSGEVAEIESV